MVPVLAITLLPTLARAIASEFISNDAILKWITAAGAVVVHGVNVEKELQPLIAQMEAIVAEQRPPTKEEWDGWKARSDAAHKIIQDWRPGT